MTPPVRDKGRLARSIFLYSRFAVASLNRCTDAAKGKLATLADDELSGRLDKLVQQTQRGLGFAFGFVRFLAT